LDSLKIDWVQLSLASKHAETIPCQLHNSVTISLNDHEDESGCNQRIGLGRTGWSLVDATPLQVSNFQRPSDIKCFLLMPMTVLFLAWQQYTSAPW
jgi:hypothetical protein